MAERRAYLAIAGGVLLVPWLLGKIKLKPLRVAMGVAAGVAVLICTGATFQPECNLAEPCQPLGGRGRQIAPLLKGLRKPGPGVYQAGASC